MIIQQDETERVQRAQKRAQEIIDQEWRDAGYSQEQIDQSKELTTIFDRLMGVGCLEDLVRAVWEAEYPDTVAVYRRLWPLAETLLPLNDPFLAVILYRLAKNYETEGQHETAAGLYARVLKIQEQASGQALSRMADVRDRYAASLRANGWGSEADAATHKSELLAA